MIQRRQADGILQIQIRPEIDQCGERRRLLFDDCKVQRRAAVVRAIHPPVQIDARVRQLADHPSLAQGDG